MEGDYEVGYRKPPKHTRFKKGQSGNPKGRPKREKETWRGAIEDEFNQTIMLTENGRPVRVTAKRALVKRLMVEAVGGDKTAWKMLLALLQHVEKHGEPASTIINISAGDAEVL